MNFGSTAGQKRLTKVVDLSYNDCGVGCWTLK
jgi:hypothetical protein